MISTSNDDIRPLTALNADTVAACAYDAIRHCATHLRPDMLAAVREALIRETSPRARSVLQSVIDNAAIAANDGVPLCQDTGSVWIDVEIGPDQCLPGDLFSNIDAAVARAYDEGRLRYSIVADALVDRRNTETNAPAFCEIHLRPEPGARLSVMLKGGGSDNASRVAMLVPGVGRAGILETVVSWVRQKAANACPPLFIGIGVGGTFDTVAHLAKTALLRPIGTPNADREVAAFEQELLAAVNATGIGPAALGGDTTALGVAINTAPCHIAALPMAINMGCIALRSASIELTEAANE